MTDENSKLFTNNELLDACRHSLMLLKTFSENPEDMELASLENAINTAEEDNVIKLGVLKEYMSQAFAKAGKEHPDCRPALRKVFAELFQDAL